MAIRIACREDEMAGILGPVADRDLHALDPAGELVAPSAGVRRHR
jgi:hypothetical protein